MTPTEKTTLWATCFAGVINLAIWAAIIVVAIHFIRKFW